MARPQTSAPGKPTERGFTLLELLVVVALLGVLAWLGAQALPQWRRSPAALQAGLTKVLQDARQQSMQSGEIVSVSCPALEKKLSELLEKQPLPEFRFDCSSAIKSEFRQNDIVFYPDGSSSGGTVGFEVERPQRLSVDWLTGSMVWE